MDNLKAIIRTMSNEDIREFRVFINRQKRKKERKDLELFEILLEPTSYKPDEIIHKLYGKRNKEAYHALRKRLIRHLTDFIVLKQMDDDTSASSSIMGMLSLARYMFEKNDHRLAWTYLRKAETAATNNEQFELLNTVYNQMIEEANSEYADDLNEIIRKRDVNKAHADEDEKAAIANAIIRQKLREVRLQGASINFDEIIERTYEEYGLKDIIHQRPKLLYNTLSIARSAILAKKDYYSFEPFIIGMYEDIKRERGFVKSSHFYKLSFLYVIAHTLYRNKKFEDGLRYVEELGAALEEFNRSHYNVFYTRYVLLLAALKSFTGHNQESVQLLEEFIAEEKHHLNTRDYLNAKLNVAVYYFQQTDYRMANRWLMDIHHTDRWLEKKMGKEWVFKKGLIEVIVQYEMGNEDISLNRIRSIERYFGNLFNTKTYRRAKLFMQYVRAFIKDPLVASDEDFKSKVHDTLVIVDREQEDIQAMTFYAWLKAKLSGQPYYEVLLELVNEGEQITE